MVEHIEDPIFSGPCESIKNWDDNRRTSCDAVDILRDHKISKMIAKTKRAIFDEINSLLLGKGSNKRRDTGDTNNSCALKLGGKEDDKRSEDLVPFKLWKMLTTDFHAYLRRGNSVKIGLVKDNAAKRGKYLPEL